MSATRSSAPQQQQQQQRQPPPQLQKGKLKKDIAKHNSKNNNNNNQAINDNNNNGNNTNEEHIDLLSHDHNDSGYETHEHQSNDLREDSSGSGDSLRQKNSNKKPSKPSNTATTSSHSDGKNNPKSSDKNNFGANKNNNNEKYNDTNGINGDRYEDVSNNLERVNGEANNPNPTRVRIKTAKSRRTHPTLTDSNVSYPDSLGSPSSDSRGGNSVNTQSLPSSVLGSNTSIRSRGSDSSLVSDKRVSFKEDLIMDSETKNSYSKLDNDRTHTNGSMHDINGSSGTYQKSSPLAEKGSPVKKANTMTGSMTARDSSRPNEFKDSRSNTLTARDPSTSRDDGDIKSRREAQMLEFSRDESTTSTNQQMNNPQSRSRGGSGNGSQNQSQQRPEEDMAMWQKSPMGGRSPVKDTYDTISIASTKSSRLFDRQGWLSSRDDSGYETTGRKFTRKAVRSNLGSSTTLSSNTDGDDSDDVFNVVLRVRPLNDQERSRRDKFVADFPGDGQVSVNNSGTNRNFQFNVVFEPDADQEDVFESSGIKRLVENSISGYSCTAFAFGQTGSGKTHTMTGPPAQFHQEGVTPDPSMYGMMQRAFKYLFQMLKKQGPKVVRASYLEVYNEQVIDLLNNSHKRYLAVRWSKNRGFYVENLFTVECTHIDDLMAVLEEGLRNRQTGSHGLNEFSSRSHSVLTVTIDSETQAEGEDENLYITKRGKLSFVDLAGSEKVKDANSTGGPGMTESNSINKSLLVLGNCISHLGDPKRRQGHIPYRDSKLTKLLADSLGGNGITLMIACITPSSSNTTETLNTLRYASRAKKIKTRATVKMDPREKLIVSLKKENKVLRNENHYLRQQLDFPAKPKGQLQKENDEKFMKFMKETQQKESGMYEMLQEYMVENETLRAENMEMQGSKDTTRREQQQLHRENERLSKRVEELERIISEHPNTWAMLDPHRRTDGYSHNDLSPRGSPVNVGYFSPTGKPSVRPTDLPIGGSNRGKVGSPHVHPKKPPHRLPDHVTRPAPRPVDYVEEGYGTNGYMSPRQPSLANNKHGPGSPHQVDRRASQVSHTDVIRANNEKLKQDLLHLEGEIQQHARIAHSNQPPISKFMR